jgi:hypothetical protein
MKAMSGSSIMRAMGNRIMRAIRIRIMKAMGIRIMRGISNMRVMRAMWEYYGH